MRALRSAPVLGRSSAATFRAQAIFQAVCNAVLLHGAGAPPNGGYVRSFPDLKTRWLRFMILKMRKSQKRILLVMGWYDHRLHQGIARYAEERDWHLCADVTKEKVIPWGWEGDGILAWLGAGEDLADFVVKAKLPTVDFSFRRPHLPFPRVLADHAAVSQLASEHFLVRGMKNFMFYSAVENWSYQEVGEAFVRAVREAGHDCNWIRWHQSPAFTTGHLQWKHKRRWLASQLKQAARPLAL